MKRPTPIKPMTKLVTTSNCKMYIIANRKRPNMKAAMNIEVPMANFNSDSLAKSSATPIISHEKQMPN